MRLFTCLIFFLLVNSCTKKEIAIQPINTSTDLYFPPINNSFWEKTSPTTLGWNQNSVRALNDFLIEKNTKSFLILVDGKIVLEEYFNNHKASDTWEWNSAGKTLIAATTGIAQQEGFININNKVSDYLGKNWTNMPIAKENEINVKHLLTMTSGNDDSKQLIIKQNLTYIADSGTRWAYSNIFQKMIDVINIGSKTSFETYFNEKLKEKIGMDGFWNFSTIFTIYHSTARGMARFGLLALNNGKWQNEQIVAEKYFVECTSTSQEINPSYGYLWWLNGKNKFMIPDSQTVFTGSLIPNAPADMFAAMGANDQRIYIIPSKKMVIIRMGDASNPKNRNFAVSGFDNELWAKINLVIN